MRNLTFVLSFCLAFVYVLLRVIEEYLVRLCLPHKRRTCLSFDSNECFSRNFLDQEEIVSICQIHDEYNKCVSDR